MDRGLKLRNELINLRPLYAKVKLHNEMNLLDSIHLKGTSMSGTDFAGASTIP
jgi:hypothetical protein